MGPPVVRKECRTDPLGYKACYRVEYCGASELSATLTDDSPFSCGCLIPQAIVSSGSSVDRDITHKTEGIVIKPANITIFSTNRPLENHLHSNSYHPSEEGEMAMMYPNPVTNTLNIAFKDGLLPNSFHIVIADILGQEVLNTYTDENITLNLSDLKTGTYFVTLFDQNGRFQSQQVFKH